MNATQDGQSELERLRAENAALRDAAWTLITNEDHRRETCGMGYSKGSPTWYFWEDLRELLK